MVVVDEMNEQEEILPTKNTNNNGDMCHNEEEKDDSQIDSEIEQLRLELEQIRLRYTCHTQEEEEEEKTIDDHDEDSGSDNNNNSKNNSKKNSSETPTAATYLNLFLQLEQLRDEYELIRSDYLSLVKEGRSDGRTLHLYTDAIMEAYESRQQEQQDSSDSSDPSLIGLETQVVRSFHQICNLDIQHQLCYRDSKSIIKHMESTLSQMYELKSREETQHLTILMDMSKAMDEQSQLYQNLLTQTTKSCDSMRKSVDATQSLHSFLMPVAATVKKTSVGSPSSSSLSTRPRRTKQPPQDNPKTQILNKENHQSSSTRSLQRKKKKTLRPSTNRNIKQQKRLSSLTKSVAPNLTYVEKANTATTAHHSPHTHTTPKRSNNHNKYNEEKDKDEQGGSEQVYGSISIPDRRQQQHGKDAKAFPTNDNASTISTTSSLTMDAPTIVPTECK